MRNILAIMLLISFSTVSSQNVSFILLNAPAKSVFLAGSFNQWNPGDSAFLFKPDSLGQAVVNVADIQGKIEFKLCLGSWQTVEVKKNGEDISNRVIVVCRDTVVFITVEAWKNELTSPCSSTALYVEILNDSAFVFNNVKRAIRVFLPSGYSKSDKKYPVFYLHDGQNLFDNCTSFSGEWGIDETLDSLQKKGFEVPIVVGIDNGGSERLNEYSPWVNTEYGGGKGEAYIEFVAKTLKTFIDTAYRTYPDRENTFIGGSSMGGLISVYACCKYPDIFSKALIFSPAFAFSDSLFLFLDTLHLKLPIKFYMLAGTNEHVTMVPNMQKMETMLQSTGLEKGLIFNKALLDGEHKEWFWKREFKNAFIWLHKN